jgi:hypothetical protein
MTASPTYENAQFGDLEEPPHGPPGVSVATLAVTKV